MDEIQINSARFTSSQLQMGELRGGVVAKPRRTTGVAARFSMGPALETECALQLERGAVALKCDHPQLGEVRILPAPLVTLQKRSSEESAG